MVSKASDDFPEPESPVITVRVPRGISTSIFLRLCTLAPITLRVAPDSAGALIELSVIILGEESRSYSAGAAGVLRPVEYPTMFMSPESL